MQKSGSGEGGRDACLGRCLLVCRAGLSHPAIPVLDQPRRGALPLDGHCQRRGRQLGAAVVAHGPAHNLSEIALAVCAALTRRVLAARLQGQDPGPTHPALARRHVGQIRPPSLVPPVQGKSPPQQIARNPKGLPLGQPGKRVGCWWCARAAAGPALPHAAAGCRNAPGWQRAARPRPL